MGRAGGLTAAVIAGAMVVISACGGSDPEAADTAVTEPRAAQETPTTTATPPAIAPPLTKEQFVAAANEVCRSVESQVIAFGEPTKAPEYATYMKQLVAVLKDGQAKLRALAPPPDDRASLDSEFLALNDEQNAVLEAALPAVEQAAATNDVARVQEAMTEPFERFGAIAERQRRFGISYGLRDCVDSE